MDLALLSDYAVFFLTFVGIYAILCLGLNVQWGFTGLFNIGVAAFFSVGAYTSTILTTPESPNYLGGFGLPIALGFVAAMIAAGTLGFLVGIVTVRLRGEERFVPPLRAIVDTTLRTPAGANVLDATAPTVLLRSSATVLAWRTSSRGPYSSQLRK